MNKINIIDVKLLLKQMAIDLGLPISDIFKLAVTAPYRYKVFKIPKKVPGQYRVIAQPTKEVKLLQRWVVDNILTNLPIHSAATAYVRRSGIKENAAKHKENAYLLKMDFVDFFPSIIPTDFQYYINMFAPDRYDDNEICLLSRILFWKNRETNKLQLSIGSPSSPILSNIVMYIFDDSIDQYCKENGIVYTRYADDLVLSTDSKDLLKNAQYKINELVSLIEHPNITVNIDKTKHLSKKGNRKITGLVITNDNKLSIGREAKRLIRSKLHHFIAGKLEADEIISLKGYVAYINDVEPIFLKKLFTKYGAEHLRQLYDFSN